MEKMYRIVNYETGEVAEGSALPENRSYLLGWYYKRAMSWVRDNIRCGYIGAGNRQYPKRGVHLYALKDGEITREVPLV